MRDMREFKLSTKIPAFLVFSLAASLLVATVIPRPVSAEAPLLHSVRCLVRTVLLSDCKPVSTTSPAPAPQSQPTAPQQNPAPTQPATAAPSQQSKPSATEYPEVPIIPLEPIALPDGEILAPNGIVATSPTLSTGYGIEQSEYVAYFNEFSPYAVAGAQQVAEASTPLRQSTEGWKIFGAAWYWWGLALVVAVLALPSVRKEILRKMSALSKNH